MKYSYYLASLCLLFSTCCYSQHYQIEDKYRGDPFFRKININKLGKDCTYPLDYWQLDDSKQKKYMIFVHYTILNSILKAYINLFIKVLALSITDKIFN